MSKCTMPREWRKLSAAAMSTAILRPLLYHPNSRRELPAALSCRQDVRSRPAQYLGGEASRQGVTVRLRGRGHGERCINGLRSQAMQASRPFHPATPLPLQRHPWPAGRPQYSNSPSCPALLHEKDALGPAERHAIQRHHVRVPQLVQPLSLPNK